MASILYFSTTWCGPCKMFKPVVQQVQLETGIPVQYVDAEQSPDLASKYQVSSVPTIVVTDGITVLYKHTGAMPKSQLQNLFNTFR